MALFRITLLTHFHSFRQNFHHGDPSQAALQYEAADVSIASSFHSMHLSCCTAKVQGAAVMGCLLISGYAGCDFS